MYKAQFARWGWSKYNCKRMRQDISSGKAVVKARGKSCYRVKRRRSSKKEQTEQPSDTSEPSPASAQPRPTSEPPETSQSPASSWGTPPTTATQLTRRPPGTPPIQLPQFILHANDTTRYIQSILTDIKSHVCEIFSRKPDWHQSRASKIGLISAYEYSSYDHFVIAMDAFVKNEHTNGGEMLRRAFLEVEEAIQTDYASTFYFFFIDLPDLFLHYGRHDILTILLGHIKRLTRAVTLRERISGTGFASLHALAETDPAYLRHYIATASALWCDLLADLRGPMDRSTLLARRNHLRHDRSSPDDHRYRVGRLCEDYVVLLRGVHEQFGGPGHDMSRHMEDVVLSTQMVHDFFVEGFVPQNEDMIASLEAKYRRRPPLYSTGGGSGGAAMVLPLPVVTNGAVGGREVDAVPLEEWDVLDRSIRSNCYHRLSYFFCRHGDYDRACYYWRKATEGWRDRFWLIDAELSLTAAGRYFEAQSVRRSRLEAQYFRKLPENDKLMKGGDRSVDSWCSVRHEKNIIVKRR